MIAVDGNLIFSKGSAISYKNPILLTIPIIYKDYSEIGVDVQIFVQDVDDQGNPLFDELGKPIYTKSPIDSRRYSYLDTKLGEQDNQIKQILNKFRKSIEKTIIKDLKTFNSGIKFSQDGEEQRTTL